MKKAVARKAAVTPRNAAQTRDRILAAARRWFSRHSFENVGTRDIAAEAGVDVALVNRYFGSKDKLFEEVIAGGFRAEARLPEDLDQLGAHLVRQILQDAGEPGEAEPFDAFHVLLRGAGNPAIAAVVSERFHAEFVRPLARRLGGRDAELRATLIASYVIGLATMHHGLAAPGLSAAGRRKARMLAGAAIQACVG